MSSPSPPKPPDPYATSQAQTTSNVNTAIANSVLGNANEVSPLGNVNYEQTGTYTIQEPMYDKKGNITGYQPREVPSWTRTQTLSPEQQHLYDQQTQLASGLNDFAQGQLDSIDQLLSTPLSLEGLPEMPTADRGHYEEALFARLNPQLERDRLAMENKLANQGIMPGSEAYREAIALSDRGMTDARMQAILAAGDYAGQELEQGATTRERALQERLLERNQPINEISTLMNGGQVTMPQFTQYRGGTIAPTDVAGNVYRSYQGEVANYQAKAAQQQAMMGGLFGLGANALMFL